MDVFQFSPATGEFFGFARADESPLEPGVYLAPANSTGVAPPEARDHQVALWRNGAWTLTPDYRGWTGYDVAGNQVSIEAIGVIPDPTWSDQPPAAVVAAEAVEKLNAAARSALATSDITVLRCYEVGAPLPADWAAYRKALRAIISGSDTTSSTLPPRPSYPAGT